MPYNEADTRAKLIDPAIHKRGWTEDLIRREETAGTVEIIGGKGKRRQGGKVDYVLRVKVRPDTQPVALALIEAKRESQPPEAGLDQGKCYASCDRLNVSFVYSSNGHKFVEFDRFTGLTSPPKPMEEFPTPAELLKRYETGMGFTLESPASQPLLQPYPNGEGTRRYYQDAAIRAVMEKIARCEQSGEPKRALLSMATGCGKTFIAVNLLKRISDAGQLTRALFVCDRDELRAQALTAFQGCFGTDAARVSQNRDGINNAKNARIHIATYQTLGVNSEKDDASFLTNHYPENYFTHIVIDECHRSAWGKWSQVLTRNDKAVHIGLTATPRQLKCNESTDEVKQDVEITANNLKYFGDPVYEYSITQAIEDGYLAACEIQKGRVNLDETGLTAEEVIQHDPVDALTGEPVVEYEVPDHFTQTDFETRLLLPDRVQIMCENLFQYLIASDTPEQKTIIFCTRDFHADRVAACMNNLYAEWCTEQGKERLEHYAFKCTAASSGNDQLPDLRSSSRSHFIATTVDLLSTGVDVPCVRNIVFFRYIKSPISLHQMAGRGTRIDVENGKLMFRIYDYTNATRLFGDDFIAKPIRTSKDGRGREDNPPTLIEVEGFEVHISDAGRFVVADVDGRPRQIPLEEYKARLAARLVQETKTLNDFRTCWIQPPKRETLVRDLTIGGYSPRLIRAVDKKEDYDLYDILAELGWGMSPRTRIDRALAFRYKNEDWIRALPEPTVDTIYAIADQFTLGGTDSLETRSIFEIPEVRDAGGLDALRLAGDPGKLLIATKERMFAS